MPPSEPAAQADEGRGGDLDAHLRHADPDRWLAARLVGDAARRRSLLALYALNDEIARVAESVRLPMLGEMRFAWWREAVEEAAAGRPRIHPVLQAISPLLQSGAVSTRDVDAILTARHLDLEPQPFADETALVAYLDATAGAVMRAAARLLDPAAPPGSVRSAARAWGWSGLMRAEPAWRARGRRWAPLEWGELAPYALAERARARAAAALETARGELGALPVASFPAVAYVHFVRDHLRGRSPGEFARRAELLWAAAHGRI